MRRLLTIAVLCTGLFAAALIAQEQLPQKKAGDTPAKAAEPIPGDIEVNFLNGSIVRMIVLSDKLEVDTLYGKLTVPIKDVRGVEFGLHYPEGMQEKIDIAVKKLASGDYREREKSTASLLEMGPYSYPAVVDATRSKEVETARRAKEIMTKMQAKHPKKDLKTSSEDKVITQSFTIVGKIMTPTIKAKTEYFGEVTLHLAKMRTMKAVAAPGVDMDVVVDASKYANQGQWMDTNFAVDGKSALVITAKGLVDQWPQQPGNYMCGPGGMQAGRVNFGGFGGGGGGMPAIAGGRRIIGPINNNQYGGMLIAKIGEDGEMFMIGDRYEATPENEGKLYLHIGPSPWGCQSGGNYDVKIMRKN